MTLTMTQGEADSFWDYVNGPDVRAAPQVVAALLLDLRRQLDMHTSGAEVHVRLKRTRTRKATPCST